LIISYIGIDTGASFDAVGATFGASCSTGLRGLSQPEGISEDTSFFSFPSQHGTMTPIFCVEVENETDAKMKSLPEVRWDSVVRDAIAEKLREELGPDQAKQREAARRMDEMRKPSPPGWNSTEEIRKWRDRR